MYTLQHVICILLRNNGPLETTYIYKYIYIYIYFMNMSACQSHLTLWPHGVALPGSSVHGIFQARIMGWVTISSARGSSRPRDQTCDSVFPTLAGGFFTTAPPGRPYTYLSIICLHTHMCVRVCVYTHISHLESVFKLFILDFFQVHHS